MSEAIWLRFRGSQAEQIFRAIQYRNEFTTTVARSEVKPKSHQICLISLEYRGIFSSSDEPNFSIDYVGISRKGSLIATDQLRIKVSNLIQTEHVDVQQIVETLPAKFGNRLPGSYGDPIRLPPKLSEAFIGAIQGASQSVRNGMPSLRSHLSELDRTTANPEGGLETFERDAVVTSLETFGGTRFRKEILRGTEPASPTTPSFLQQLSHYDIREDTQINFDAISFPGFKVAEAEVFGAVQVVNSVGQTLTIMNCNRQPLEHTLGVDLIYYSHSYRSFVLIQYKRLTSESGSTPVYRPDSDRNYSGELQRMNDAARELSSLIPNDGGINSYRLGNEAFYFKFCEARQKSALDAGMISGMYIPLGLWNQFVRTSEARGPRGGLRIDWDNHPRSLNNSRFCQLLKEGWIGSSAKQTERLDYIIEGTLAGKKMLVLAATSPSDSRPDQLRDDLGRFTEVDDQLGER
ncbi:hypothetical protein V7x_40340 [Crateriforma conspicua]|uniref:Uncharacterized protein n=1 Tax=Crateriforma conspicua TaxID=2527996 RepID=A0A5C6FJ84_9PLAN|nr:hypothetical protein [Crateriforma conspicua]TWU62305.1 hypothetical protein V7x_40340 [Crateriforma conspicua]